MLDHRKVARRVGQAVVGLVVAMMYAPVAMIFVYSFNESRIGSVWTGFSTRWYVELFRQRDLWDGLKVSLAVGVAASLVSVALGGLAALGLNRWRSGLAGWPEGCCVCRWSSPT